MKILVIDDTQKHLDSAVKTLEGHDVTLCTSYDEALELLEPKKETPYWDAVLCDLLMPAGRDAQGSDKYVGQEMPVGWSLALVAAMRGTKYVAVASDMNHHDHPGSAMLDRLDGYKGHIFNIDGATVLMTNKIGLIELGGEEDVDCCVCSGTKFDCNSWNCSICKGTLLIPTTTEECFCVIQHHCDSCKGTGKRTVPKRGKDWGKILDRLLNAK